MPATAHKRFKSQTDRQTKIISSVQLFLGSNRNGMNFLNFSYTKSYKDICIHCTKIQVLHLLPSHNKLADGPTFIFTRCKSMQIHNIATAYFLPL
jgi:hypothetical protein